MNIIKAIQEALTALNSDADLFLLEESRADNEELEHTRDSIIVYPDWEGNSNFTQGMEITTQRVYNIQFKTPDEWDNSDGDLSKSYENETSADKIERMEALANSIFTYISTSNNYQEINQNLRWRLPYPILRANNGTMTGVMVQLTVNFKGSVICDYTP